MPPLIVSKQPGGGFVRTSQLVRESRYDWPGGVLPKPPPPAPPRHPARQQQSTEYGDIRSQLVKLEEAGVITVKVDGEEVFIYVDPEKGPRWGQAENDFVVPHKLLPQLHKEKIWDFLSINDKEELLIRLAKKFHFWGFNGKGLVTEGDQVEEREKTREELEEEARAAIAERCAKEQARATPQWETITIDQVTANHRRRAPGMFYGLEFPWTEAMLIEMGPEWLTRAFHTAGTLSLDNRITKIIPEKKLKITTGNNGGKFLFDVKYARKRQGLHTRLFAKVPFPLEGVTRTDRLSSSVNKQPQEFYELNTSRLLEAALPVKTPRYYFGDINNETSNWILITEAIPFNDPEPLNFGAPQKRNKRLPAYMVEGPYDKCMDHTLRGKPVNYYTLLVTTGARIAGMHKAGKLGPEELLRANFGDMADKPFSFFGLSVGSHSGDDPRVVKPKLDLSDKFLSETAKVLFPEYVTEEYCAGKLRDILLTVNGYSGEIMYWKHQHQEYVALTHCNLNVDNAYFWRDEEGKLELGVFDWGNMGSMAIGHKLWWWLYCADYENFRDNLDSYVSAFVDSYAESGGPKLNNAQLRWHIIITSIEQLINLCFAVPQINKMCKKEEWATIEDRYDPRISLNIDGKSSLRLYLHVMNSVIRIIEEMEGAALLDKWVTEIWAGEFKLPAKPRDVLHGLVRTQMGL